MTWQLQEIRVDWTHWTLPEPTEPSEPATRGISESTEKFLQSMRCRLRSRGHRKCRRASVREGWSRRCAASVWRVSLLDVRNLEITYALRNSEVVAVHDVSFSISPGECLGVVGESGCGKSTIGMAIMQLLATNGRISAGEISLNGQNLVGIPDKEMRKFRGKSVALIPQDPMTSLNPVMRIGDQIAEGYRIHHKVPKEQATQRAIEVLRIDRKSVV